MALLQELIDRIDDPILRGRIAEEVRKTTKSKKFGLVFEEHLPECTPLYDIPIKKGSLVALKGKEISASFIVKSIKNNKAVCINKNTKEIKEFDVVSLVSIAEFGNPIYPYLKPIDSVENAPDSKLWHALIEADNYHALQLLEYLYAGKVDCIYIDPPYNTGAKDWKYNNNYVDGNDEYRHSKWLSFMKKRLKLARNLLNHKNSILIVTIDDKEYLHLGCLLEELFPDGKITMISSVINPVGKAKKGGTDFSRTDEYIFFIQFGSAAIQPELRETSPVGIRWQTFRRSSLANGRGKHGIGACGPNQFYPIYIDDSTFKVVEVGYPIAENVDRFSVKQIPGCSAVFPVRKDGIEINWGATRERVLELLEKGYFKVIPKKLDEPQQYKIKYLTTGVIKDIEEGRITITGTDETGAVVGFYETAKEMVPTTNWNKSSHNATSNGTDLLTKIFHEQRFDYSKSLYAVHDTIKCAVSNNPNALILDFFAGSGTTLHAVNLLNKEDGGHRQCILVTNNEVSEEERVIFSQKGIEKGSSEWESHGIAQYVAWPRIVCSVIGTDVMKNPLKDDYITFLNRRVFTDVKVHQISFIDDFSKLSLSEKRQVTTLITKDALPGKIVDNDMDFVVSEDIKHTASILFNDTKAEEWIDELADLHHITDLYVITKKKNTFNQIKKIIRKEIPQLEQNEAVKMPMADGFASNVFFFKMGFLNKTEVALGSHFFRLLPVLWMKSGAIGKCPTVEETTIPNMLILPQNQFAVLTNESCFMEFLQKLEDSPDIQTVFFVTDSESSYNEMSSMINVKSTYQLYRDYLDNFKINTGRI